MLITKNRIFLRDFKTADFEAVQKYASDPEVVKFVPWGPNTEDDTKNFLKEAVKSAKANPRENYELAIILSSTKQLIGGARLFITSWENKTGMLGYCLNQDFWHRGLASEATQALLELGFLKLKLHRLIATVDTENYRSIKVLEKLKFRKEANFKQDVLIKNKWRDSYLYAILAEEFNT